MWNSWNSFKILAVCIPVIIKITDGSRVSIRVLGEGFGVFWSCSLIVKAKKRRTKRDFVRRLP